MPTTPRVPDALRHRPFTRAQALDEGLTPRMLNGASYRRLFPRVWVHRAHEMSEDDWIAAARLAVPSRAHLTDVSRLRLAGVEVGPVLPVHFVVQGDLHLDLERIVVHRTERLPPLDTEGVSLASAYLHWCGRAMVIEAIGVGDELLRTGAMSVLELAELARRDRWRAGAREAAWISAFLRENVRSRRESSARAYLMFAGLPEPELNGLIVHEGRVITASDLLYRRYRTVAEYDGGHHQRDRRQYLDDLARNQDYRDLGLEYVIATKETSPQRFVAQVYDRIVRRGYAGPPPCFGGRWASLFRPIAQLGRLAERPHAASGDVRTSRAG